MFIIKYALPIASALLLILFFSALPALHVCTLPLDAPAEGDGLPGADRRRFSRRDWAALLLILAVYAAAAFWQLGDTSGPETFVSMAGESAEIQLQGEEAPEKILLFPGVGMGGYTVEYSEDGESYTQVTTFDQGHIEVLKWTELPLETEQPI